MPAQATTARRVTRSAKLLTVGFGPAALSMPSSTSTRSRATRITRNNFAPSSIPAITFTPTTRATRRWPNPSIFRFLIRKNESHRGFRGRPISLADACLIRCAEIYEEARILTYDSDFGLYRWARNKKFQRFYIPDTI